MRTLMMVVAGFNVAADWPQFQGPNRDNTSSETGLARAWPKGGPKVFWKHDAGSGWAGPAVVGERAVLFHRVGDEDVLECVEASTGKPVWKQSYPTSYIDTYDKDNGPRATPAIVGDKVFTLGANGELSAFTFTDGKRLWQRNINKEYKVEKGFFGAATSPIVVDDKLIINVGGKGAGVVAFDPGSGKELWKASDDAVSYSSPTVAKIDGEVLVVFFTRQGLLALTPGKGEVRYSHPWRPRLNASVNAAAPIVSENQIFLSTSYSTGAILLEANKGELKEIWKGDKSLSCHYNTPVLVNGYLYGIDGRQEGQPELRCVEWKTGKVMWKKEGFGCASLIVADGIILAFCESGDLVMFEPNTESYKELARASILDKSPCRAAFALSGGKVFARDAGKWICVDVKK